MVCVFVRMYATSTPCLQKPRKGVRSPVPGVTDNYEQSSVGAGNKTQRLWESSKFLPEPSLQPRELYLTRCPTLDCAY